jgi:hypothetical protein
LHLPHCLHIISEKSAAAEVNRKIEHQYPLFFHLSLSNSLKDANKANPINIMPDIHPIMKAVSKFHHFPRGQVALLNLALAGIIQPHFLHCCVNCISSGHVSQMSNLSVYLSSVTLCFFGLNKSQGLTISIPPFLFHVKHCRPIGI